MSKINFETITPDQITKLSNEERNAYIAFLTGQNAAMRAALAADADGALTFKVGIAGGLVVYGLARFPVTLYKAQWKRLLDGIETVREGSTIAKLFKALENPELSTGKDDPRYTEEIVKAARLAKDPKNKAKQAAPAAPAAPESVLSTDMTPRLAGQPSA